MEKFKTTFSRNVCACPVAILDACIKSFLDKLYTSDKVHTCSKKIVYFCLPYNGYYGLQICSQLMKLLSSTYPHLSVRVVFRPSSRLSSFFPFKDRIPNDLRSHVVYFFKCQCCGALYVGQTRRHIHPRNSEPSVSTMSSTLAHTHFNKSGFRV